MRAMWWGRCVAAGLAAVVAVAGVGPGRAQNLIPKAGGRAPAAVVRDGASLFSAGAASRAEALLREAEAGSRGRLRVVVETVPSLGGRSPAAAAAERARAAGVEGLYVLIARDERKFQIEPAGPDRGASSRAEQQRLGRALTGGFRRGDFDAGLLAMAAEARRAALGFGVRDDAGLFSPEAVADADAALDDVRARTGWGAIIETTDSLGGKPIDRAALDNARALQVHGLYILIPKQERKVWVLPGRSAEAVFGRDRVAAINDALTTAFRAGRFDRGLSDAVAQIREAATAGAGGRGLAASRPAAEPPARPTATPPAPVATAPEPAPVATAPEPAPAADPGTATPTEPAPAPQPVPRPRPTPVEEAPGGGIGTVLMLGGAVLVGLWLISRIQRPRPATTEPGAAPATTPPPATATPPGAAPARFATPQAPRSGPPPQPGTAPSYGYGPQAPPAPGVGGGGFASGMLGGLGGAVLGNMLYDQFGRPRPATDARADVGGPPADRGWADAGGLGPSPDPGPRESYDPAAGVGGDWGTPDAPPPDITPDDRAAAESAGVGGGWDEPDAPPASDGWGDDPAPDDGGDWDAGSQGEGGSW